MRMSVAGVVGAVEEAPFPLPIPFPPPLPPPPLMLRFPRLARLAEELLALLLEEEIEEEEEEEEEDEDEEVFWRSQIAEDRWLVEVIEESEVEEEEEMVAIEGEDGNNVLL